MTTHKQTFARELEVTGQELVEQIQELLRQGNTRRVTIHAEDGHELLSVPLTVGVVAGGLVTLSAPVLAGLGALAAMVSHARLIVTHEPEVPLVASATTPAQQPPDLAKP
jgi:Domain of unknown function (DUF4342)